MIAKNLVLIFMVRSFLLTSILQCNNSTLIKVCQVSGRKKLKKFFLNLVLTTAEGLWYNFSAAAGRVRDRAQIKKGAALPPPLNSNHEWNIEHNYRRAEPKSNRQVSPFSCRKHSADDSKHYPKCVDYPKYHCITSLSVSLDVISIHHLLFNVNCFFFWWYFNYCSIKLQRFSCCNCIFTNN